MEWSRDTNRKALNALLIVALAGAGAITILNTYYFVFRTVESNTLRLGISIVYFVVNEISLLLFIKGLRETYDTATEKLIGYTAFGLLIATMILGLWLKGSESGFVTMPLMFDLQVIKRLIVATPAVAIASAAGLWWFDPQARNARIASGASNAAEHFTHECKKRAVSNMRGSKDLQAAMVELNTLELQVEALAKSMEGKEDWVKSLMLVRGLSALGIEEKSEEYKIIMSKLSDESDGEEEGTPKPKSKGPQKINGRASEEIEDIFAD